MKDLIDRVALIAENIGITITSLEKEIGASKGVLSRALKQKTDIQSKWVTQLVENYPQFNALWLLTGEGQMLKSDKIATQMVSEPGASYNLKPNSIPLVMPTAVGGFGSASFAIEDRDVKEYYVVPKFKHKKIDFMIEVEGSSMYPKYNSGDVVACKIINETNFIQWNKTHVVSTRDQGILIKRLKPSSAEDLIKMVSDNKDYDPFDVHKDEISGIALVVGVIRLE